MMRHECSWPTRSRPRCCFRSSIATGGTTTYTYDAAGNQTLEVNPADQRTTSTWNDDNRRTRVETASGEDIQAKYDYDGPRREKVDTSGAIRRFVSDGQNYRLETTGVLNQIEVAYAVEPHTYGNVVSKADASSTLYYHGDALGSTRFLTDFSQTQQDTYLDEAWGNPVASTGSSVNPFRWVGAVGYYYDEELGTDYIRARHYEPNSARWMSQDPLFAAGMLKLVNFGRESRNLHLYLSFRTFGNQFPRIFQVA